MPPASHTHSRVEETEHIITLIRPQTLRWSQRFHSISFNPDEFSLDSLCARTAWRREIHQQPPVILRVSALRAFTRASCRPIFPTVITPAKKIHGSHERMYRKSGEVYLHTCTKEHVTDMKTRVGRMRLSETLTERRRCKPAAVWPVWPVWWWRLPVQTRCESDQTSTTDPQTERPASMTAERYWQNPPSDGNDVKDHRTYNVRFIVSLKRDQLNLCVTAMSERGLKTTRPFGSISKPTLMTSWVTHLSQLFNSLRSRCFCDTKIQAKVERTRWKDTALAWFMPTNTATQRMTLDHSLFSLCGSPRWLSIHGYSKPINAEQTTANAFNQTHQRSDL